MGPFEEVTPGYGGFPSGFLGFGCSPRMSNLVLVYESPLQRQISSDTRKFHAKTNNVKRYLTPDQPLQSLDVCRGPSLDVEPVQNGAERQCFGLTLKSSGKAGGG